MNICIRQIGLLLITCVCAWTAVDAQTGFNVKFGAETWSLKDEKAQAGESSHPGQMIGFDVFVGEKRMYFVPGFHYHRISVLNEEDRFSLNFSESHHMHYFTIPLMAGYKIIDSSFVNLSLLAGGEVNFFYSLDENDVGLDDNMFKGLTVALSTGLHAEFFSILTAEVRYHYGLLPILNTRDDSKLSGWTLAVGAKF